ncbi:DUF2124 domain-containing protein [Methanoculleus sp. FWC-SCC1]|uniref:DUF2124 domain-containing protein n=1 Tax=Methanoculleus frigidifontis TaxID=2584085 RepID=A0ABT8MAJ7_9EURY|nr:DUF2124 domain-containing protein [Methanoculleus sp. FWC-SCC1]MDN7024966.1 DUF2124 domain-containing protein [Methanoculleus sp. FWC-SCC1]
MELAEQLTSVPGMLRPFKAFLTEAGLSRDDQIVYYGCPGTCTPFVELLAFATRDLPCEQIFVPYVDEVGARKLHMVTEVGMQASAEKVPVDPTVIVLMGGLSMPNVPVSRDQVVQVVGTHKPSALIGVCFMKMFEKMGWLESFDFNMVIDATIDPVNIWR